MNPDPSKEDLARMQALQQKRTLAFVNHCVMTNVQCLNNFMQDCEDKLIQFERKLDRVDAAMVLLESKILSIPELSEYKAENKEASLLEPIQEDPPQTENAQSTNTQNALPSIETAQDTAQQHSSNVASRPEYNRFVKMVQVGVPLPAAKLKCALEGLDPDVLAEIIREVGSPSIF